MPDHPMTPDPFREALDNLVWAASLLQLQGIPSPLLLRARAEVERLYAARVGEGVDATVLSFAYDRLERTAMMLHAPSRGCWDAFGTGDRVFVTKGEAG